MSPQDEVARDFMQQRGYTQDPIEIEKVDGQTCWYYVYDVPEGELEIEVYWSSDYGWDVSVSSFNLNS